jgi:hypothetical protein
LLLILTDLRALDPPKNVTIGENKKSVLKTRDIPTLTNLVPPSQQLGLQSPPLSATAHFANKNAAICAVLLLFMNYHLFKLTLSVIFGGSPKFGRAERRRMP